MNNYSELLTQIEQLRTKVNHITYVPKVEFPKFPFDNMYEGQYGALKSLSEKKPCVLSSHTGSGKSAVFIGATAGEPTLIVEPRKFLQRQIIDYFKNLNVRSAILFGRSEYPCQYAYNAGVAPCLRKTRCNNTYFKNECDEYTQVCDRKPCNVFMAENSFHKYPCPNCAYFAAQNEAMSVLHASGTVVCNFGNFWNLKDHALNIVIDEADLFCREISTPKEINTATYVDMDIKKMLFTELQDIDRKMQTTTTLQYYKLSNDKYKISFLYDNAEICFAYKKKNWKTKEEKVFVEIMPDKVTILIDKVFKDKRLIIVTATPTNFELPAITYTIPQRCGIFYCPQGKLTASALHTQPWLLDNAITGFIDPMSRIFTAMYGSKKFIVHCGNIGQHATRALQLLGADDCTIHEKGQLMQTIEKFTASDKRYLLVASAEYGLDAPWCDCQFILKVPFASKDDHMRALEVKLGKEKFRKWYTTDAAVRLIQQSGRVGRGYDSFSATFVLDAKFRDVYSQYRSVFPEWFHNRLIGDV